MSVISAPADPKLQAIRERSQVLRTLDSTPAQIVADFDYLIARLAASEAANLASADFMEAALPFLRESFAALSTGPSRREYRERLERWWALR